MSKDLNLFFFNCSVSDDLYGASPNESGEPLPAPSGGKWLPLDGIEGLGDARSGFKESLARTEIAKWGCHWFTSEGPTEIYWGEDGPPATLSA